MPPVAPARTHLYRALTWNAQLQLEGCRPHHALLALQWRDVLSQKKPNTSQVSHCREISEHTFLHEGGTAHKSFSWDVHLGWGCGFYFWSNTGTLPRPPWHNHCTMGGKQVSTAAATLPALPAAHSLTTAFFTRVLAMLSPRNTHMEQANQPWASLSRSHLLSGIHRQIQVWNYLGRQGCWASSCSGSRDY